MTVAVDEIGVSEVGEPLSEPIPTRTLRYGGICWPKEGPNKGKLRLRYLPFKPHAKQASFLATTSTELFWGGSGGGGKSAALLMGALQFADVPGYQALILRRTVTDLIMPGALISMSRIWLKDRTDCSYNANERKWTFDTGPGNAPAVIQFGYLNHPQDIGRYRGTEYHYIAWDELGEIPWKDAYTFLFSRLRRPSGLSREEILAQYGAAPDGTTLLDIPLRVRSASNPGGPGMQWVKGRFVSAETREAPYMRAGYKDNPAINNAEYEESLDKLTPVERARMGDGNWDIEEVPGALWKMVDIRRDDWGGDPPREGFHPNWAYVDDDGECMSQFETVVIGVDPSVGEGAGDECGIVAAGQEADGRIVVLEDHSMSAHPDDWGREVVLLYHRLGASKVVIEGNQGMEENRTVIRAAADLLGLPRPRVVLVTAKKSKEERAATVVQAYKRKRKIAAADETDIVVHDPLVVHAKGLIGDRLEAQLCSWVPGQGKRGDSPDRLDALVYALRALLYPPTEGEARQSKGVKKKLQGWNS